MQHRLVYDGPCRDNATLACEVEHKGAQFPMVLTTKRVSPGDMNTCMPAPVCLPVGSPVRVHPHRRHVVQRRVHHQEPSPDPHAALHSRWRTGARYRVCLAHTHRRGTSPTSASLRPTLRSLVVRLPLLPLIAHARAGIFEFGFPDAILQMWAAFCDEYVSPPSPPPGAKRTLAGLPTARRR